MIVVKLLEIRDRGTFIPVFALHTQAENPNAKLDVSEELRNESYLLGRAGFGLESEHVILGKLTNLECHYDPHMWPNNRTMTTAHVWIQQNWDEITTGDVIDVEFILNESPTKKLSESMI